MNSDLTLFVIKMVIQGLISFLAILVMSKTRAASWMCMVAGFLASYVALTFELMIRLGVLTNLTANIFGMPIIDFFSALIPGLLFTVGLILRLLKK